MQPGIDGVSTARQIRALDPDIEIVIVTADTNILPQNIVQLIPPYHKLLFIQKPYYRKDGSLLTIESNSSILELGNKKYVLTFDRDITFRKKALEEKEKLLLQLRRSEKMEAIGILAGGVAHDLNNI